VPRNRIELKEKVEYLSILNGEGQVDEVLEPKLAPDRLLYLYRLMVRTRTLDERLINLQRQGRIGTYGPCRGQEAAHCGTVLALRPDDWVAPTFREGGVALHRGWPMERVLQYWGGYEEGNVAPAGVNDLPIAVPIASQVVHAMGIAWAIKLKEKQDVVLCFCGDGATSEGDFHEGLNFAGVFQMPLIVVIQNNHWAISVPRDKQTASATLAQKAVAYGFDGIQVDGNDALAVHAATQEAVDKARLGGGPTLIEAVTYRLGVHTTADDPRKYRTQEEVAKWEKLDPIPRFRGYLMRKGILTEELVKQIETEAADEVRQAVERYETMRDVDPLDCFNYMYAELPPELKEQREEFKAALERERH